MWASQLIKPTTLICPREQIHDRRLPAGHYQCLQEINPQEHLQLVSGIKPMKTNSGPHSICELAESDYCMLMLRSSGGRGTHVLLK